MLIAMTCVNHRNFGQPALTNGHVLGTVHIKLMQLATFIFSQLVEDINDAYRNDFCQHRNFGQTDWPIGDS